MRGLLFLSLACCLSLRFMNIRMAVNLWSLVTLAWLQLSTGLSIPYAAHPLMLHQRSLLRRGESQRYILFFFLSEWVGPLPPQMCAFSLIPDVCLSQVRPEGWHLGSWCHHVHSALWLSSVPWVRTCVGGEPTNVSTPSETLCISVLHSSGDDQEALFQQILQGLLNFPAPYWDNVSDNAKVGVRKSTLSSM